MPQGVGSGCLLATDGQLLGIPLSTNYTCSPGFYCPNVNASNPYSIPVSCPATPECQLKRLFSESCIVSRNTSEF